MKTERLLLLLNKQKPYNRIEEEIKKQPFIKTPLFIIILFKKYFCHSTDTQANIMIIRIYKYKTIITSKAPPTTKDVLYTRSRDFHSPTPRTQ